MESGAEGEAEAVGVAVAGPIFGSGLVWLVTMLSCMPRLHSTHRQALRLVVCWNQANKIRNNGSSVPCTELSLAVTHYCCGASSAAATVCPAGHAQARCMPAGP